VQLADDNVIVVPGPGFEVELPADFDLGALTPAQRAELNSCLTEIERRSKQHKIDQFYPDTGPLRRALYPRHLEFFWAGSKYRERCFMAGNRIGKTEGSGGYETALHLTGQYPDWWPGRRFDRPVNWWAAGKTNETTRDIVQNKLFGPISWHSGEKGVAGTGLVRGNTIGRITWKQGVQDLIDTVMVRHVTGGWSKLGLKSYQQGRGSFEGTEQDGIWLDEEPPLDIYGECLIRTATTNGLVYITFTPLEGVTGTVIQFLPGGASEVLGA
jgi:phage terminase large subunit-like protein